LPVVAWRPVAPDLGWRQRDGQLLVVVGLGHGCGDRLAASSRLKWTPNGASRLCVWSRGQSVPTPCRFQFGSRLMDGTASRSLRRPAEVLRGLPLGLGTPAL
jgi:hypothetical protein